MLILQEEFTRLDEVLPETDVLYVTRVQKERFENAEEFEKVVDVLPLLSNVFDTVDNLNTSL